MRLAGAIVLLGAALYSGCVAIAIAVWTANSNPKPLSFSDAFWDNLGIPLMFPGLLLWIIGIMQMSGKQKEKE